MRIGDEITELGPRGVYGLEINPASATDEHLAQVEERLNKLVPDHMRSEVRKHLQLAREAPGTHEAAMLERIATTVETYEIGRASGRGRVWKFMAVVVSMQGA